IKDPELQAQIRRAYRPSAVFREWWHAWWPWHRPASGEAKSHPSASSGYPIFPLSTFGQIQRLIQRVSASMHHVAAPALLLQSEQDDITSPRNAKMVYDRIRSTSKNIVLLDDCYHVITVDKQKDSVIRYLHNFFEPHAAPSTGAPSLPSPAW